MAWPTFTVDVTQNSNQIKIYGPVPASEIPAGFEVIIGNVSNLEVSYGTAIMYDGSNNPYSHLYLVRPYTGTASTNLEMVVKPTGSQFNDVVGIFQNASNLLNSTMAGFRQFVEGTTPVSFQPLDENAEPISIKPLLQMNQEAQAAVNQAISAFQNAAGTAAGYDVTSNSTDTGNGANGQPKLLKYADFGFGSGLIQKTITDFNNERDFWPIYHGNTGANRPSGVGVLLPMIRNGYGVQLDFDYLNKIYIRGFNNNVPSAWREILHTGNTGIDPVSSATTNFKGGVNLTTSNAQITTTQEGATTSRFYTDGGANIAVDGIWPIILKSNNAERMRITGAGNALIGTTTDNGVDKLQVAGGIKIGSGYGNSNPRNTLTYGLGGFGNPGDWGSDSLGDKLVLWSNGIDVDSRVGFSLADSLWVKGMGATAHNAFAVHGSTANEGSPNRLFTVRKSGAVLINTDTDNGADKLQINGSLSFRPLSSVNPTNNGELTFEMTSDTSVKVKLRGSDGVVRSATLTLS